MIKREGLRTFGEILVPTEEVLEIKGQKRDPRENISLVM